jgi:hypothetical protein
MKDWNVLLTVVPGPHHARDLLGALSGRGRFAFSDFKDVILGQVADVPAFLAALLDAGAAGARWLANLARVIPVERRFHFSPESLESQLKQAAAALLDRVPAGGSFHVRLERRGLAGRVATQQIERAVAEHLFELGATRGIELRTAFDDPDFVVAAETVGEECGVALVTRELRTRYPFIRVH